MSKKKLKLSRRNMLAGLGTIGIASAGAGFGTWAAFSDTEGGNVTFTAGELDLMVSYTASYNNERVAPSDGSSNEIELDSSDDGEVLLKIKDLKPGDVGSLNFEIESSENSNPAWVMSQILIQNSGEGENPEPETNTDDADGGELEDNLELIGFYDSNDTSRFFDQGQTGGYAFDDDGSGSAPVAPPVPTCFYDNAQPGDSPPYVARTLYDLATQDLQQGTNGSTATDANGTFTGSIIVDGKPDNTSDNTQNNGDLDPLGPGGDAGNPQNSINFGYDWHLPYTTGNAVQGDTVEIGFRFIAIQARHSDLPQNADTFTNDTGANTSNASTN